MAERGLSYGQAGIAPDPDSHSGLGVVVSVPVQHGHDVLAAYHDGSVRYMDFSGAAVVVDDASPTAGAAGRELLEPGRILVSRIWSVDRTAAAAAGSR